MEEIIKSVHISCKIKLNQLFYFFPMVTQTLRISNGQKKKSNWHYDFFVGKFLL